MKIFALYLLADTVNILSMEQHQLVGIKIVNETIAENLQRMFAAIWQK